MQQKNIFSLVLLLLLYTLLNNKFVSSYNITTYNENEENLQIFNTLSYRDGTLTIYMVKPINETCVDPNFRIRTIYPNGTTEFNVRSYPIPEFNFCKSVVAKDRFSMKVYRVSPKYSLIAYTNATDMNSSADYGILTTNNGEFLR